MTTVTDATGSLGQKTIVISTDEAMFEFLDLLAGFVQGVLVLSMGLILLAQILARREQRRE